ncbi:NTF2-like N-terminal transpeptidase [Chryseobacterium sp. IHB B 17019]|uniref:NTF2-like N-terminal transpeptidase n=1 Tax=Chryseobacterium sp. IHB B 17019 TaxID=1721091 RepID=UPI0007216CBE|nr:NTF2-like N-terminal transpeptidase [Chryseobacterium sp. IHB B 17019]ALR31993.1 NTF2-like N-terminal transpeptidase [Chryseobacterium sp. IHB B 17019]
MKKFSFLLVFSLLLFTACKKDHVDATNTKTLQSSINDMTASLPTIKQIKFNEALYILKTFGVEADGDVAELKALGQLINGKKVPEIMSMADQVAQKNGIEWASTAPPSLGEMNIFGDDKAKESDPNDVKANSLSVITRPTGDDGAGAPTAIQIVPRLVDNAGKPIAFTGAGLETTLEVFSNGVKLSTAKNLMQDNNFKGFNLKFSSIPAAKVVDNKIDITVSVKTTAKTFKMTKIGLDVNSSLLKVPAVPKVDSTAVNQDPAVIDPNNPGATTPPTTDPNAAPTTTPATPKQPASDPKSTVTGFLNNVSSQNLKAAFNASSNPSWGNYESFSNPTSGFGSVKNVSVKNITTNATTPNVASVNATYDVTDKSGKTTSLKATFGLKNVNGEWKISSYKINP